MIIVMAGLPGTGKTTLSHALAQRLAGTVLSKDAIRHAMFSPPDVEYSTQQDDFCMEIMLQTAGYILNKCPSRHVFLDGRTFSRSYQIQRVITFAGTLQQPARILECICSEATARTRLERVNDHPAANRNFLLYLELKSRFEPIAFPKSVISTDQPLELAVDQAAADLREP